MFTVLNICLGLSETADPSASLDEINRKAPVAPAIDFGWRPGRAREQRSLMKIVGCDFHPSYQQISVLDTQTGELEEKKLIHARPSGFP